MEELIKLNEENLDNEITSFQKKKNYKDNSFKRKECEVISYDGQELIFKFDDVNIRKTGVYNKDISNTVSVKYKGKIGKPNFECKIV